MHTCCSRSCMSSLKDFCRAATTLSSRVVRLEPASTSAWRWEFSLRSACSASCAEASCKGPSTQAHAAVLGMLIMYKQPD